MRVLHNRSLNFPLLTLTLGLALFLPNLVQQGMFLDGVTYAAISKNMALGLGSFFEPHYSKTLEPTFSGHPPLAFWLESFFFRFIGNHFFTEKLYSLCVAGATAWGMVLCWRLCAAQVGAKKSAWLPVLLWLLVPLVSWSYKNNMLENTVGVFALFAVFFAVKAFNGRAWYWMCISGLLVVGAFLAKGFVGLFPLASPLVFGLVFGRLRSAVGLTVVLVATVLATGGILWHAFPELSVQLNRYMDSQMVPALNGSGEMTARYRGAILLDLFRELSVLLAGSLLATLHGCRSNIRSKVRVDRAFVFFLCMGLCASLPLMVSLKQRGFYLVPSFPLFALAFGFLLLDLMEKWPKPRPGWWWLWTNRLLVAGIGGLLVFSVYIFGNYGRDETKIKEIQWISTELGFGTTISCSNALWQDWGLHAYFSRIGYVSLDDGKLHPYYLAKPKDAFPPEYTKVVCRGSMFVLRNRDR